MTAKRTEQEKKFLKALKNGLTPTDAAKKGGFSKMHFYRLKKKKPEFSKRWDELVSRNAKSCYWWEFLNSVVVSENRYNVRTSVEQTKVIV